METKNLIVMSLIIGSLVTFSAHAENNANQVGTQSDAKNKATDIDNVAPTKQNLTVTCSDHVRQIDADCKYLDDFANQRQNVGAGAPRWGTRYNP